MTGREFMIYILENHLEDEEVFKDGRLIGFVTQEEFAIKTGFGPATIQALVDMKAVPYILIGNTIFIPDSYKEVGNNEQ